MHPIHVSVMSPEEASHGVAEFWADDELVAYTRLEDGDLVILIEPRADGSHRRLGAHSLMTALLEARSLLERS